MKQYIQKQLDAVLNVGFASSKATQGFLKVGHDEYVEGLLNWLHNHQELWVIQPNFSNLQSLRDRGVDLKIDFPSTLGYVAAFQVKSHGDISSKDFSSKLWQQIGQSGSYKFDQLYIILCGDLTNPSHYQKVNGFIAEVEQGDYPWITLISPKQAWQLYTCFGQRVELAKIQERLIANIPEFLMKLDRAQELHNPHSVLANLEKLYVPPAQFPAIKETLKTKGFVVIVGDPQLGKTYAAINLLYEYYLQGYEPHWVLARNVFKSGDETPIQEVYHRQGLEDVFSLEQFIRPNHILYLEDPFGSTNKQELELVNEKNLFKVALLLEIYKSRSSDDTPPPKIVVTSRSAIFRQALQFQPDLEQYAVWLKAGESLEENEGDNEPISYGFSRRAEIAVKYQHLYEPIWSVEKSKNAIKKIEEIFSIAVSTLWTPHNLQIFFQRSANISLDDLNLKQHIIESLTVDKVFAKEIALLSSLEQLVFTVIYLINFQRENRAPWQSQFSEFSGYERYIALIQSLGEDNEEGHLAWQEVIENYSGIIELIEGSKDNWPNPTFIRFRHPVYENAVSKFLSNNPAVLDRIFAQIPALLQTTPGTHLARNLIGLIRHWHYADPAKEAEILTSFLGSNDLTLLTELAKVYAIAVPFVEDVVKSAIRQLVSHPLAQGHYNPIRSTFIKTAHQLIDMPMDQRCEILLTGLDNDPFLTELATYRPYDLVCRHYNKVTEEACEHLKRYLNQSSAAQVAARSLANYFDHLPKELQEYTENLAKTTTFGSYLSHKELISGLILGFGRFNNDARHLIRVLSNSQDFKTRAYLTSALVLIYDQLDEELLDLWHYLVHEDIPPVAVAAASRIIELKTQGICLEMLKSTNLLDFAWQCVRSSDQFIRATMLRILLDNRKEGHRRDPLMETLIKELIHDDAEVVRAAALYHLLTKKELQSEFPGRLDALMMNDTVYAQLSKLIVYTNQAPDVTQALSDEVEKIRDTNSKFLHNALVFHVSAQSPFLPSSWQTWILEQSTYGEPETIAIIRASQQLVKKTQEKPRPIFEPNWFLNYENGIETIWYQPEKSMFQTSTGDWVIISKVDELNLIFHMRQQFPDDLEC